LADLYPFRESFYDHYGYASFPLPRKVYLAPAALAPLLDMDLPGTVEQMLIADGIDAYRSLARKVHPRVHGMAMFDQTETILPQRNIYWVALAKISGETAGAMVYDLKGEDLADFTMRVVRFHYLTSQARYLLLSWIARHIDQASRVDMRLPAYEQPEMWLADLQVKSESQVRAPMGRVLDVAKIGGMPTGPGRFAARIVDPLCPWNEGIWQFETVHGVLDVRPAGQADCSLGVQALAALIFGTHDPADFAMRGWGDPPENVQATMKVMFPPLLPHLNEQF
jgi:predicted acetyltransferase